MKTQWPSAAARAGGGPRRGGFHGFRRLVRGCSALHFADKQGLGFLVHQALPDGTASLVFRPVELRVGGGSLRLDPTGASPRSKAGNVPPEEIEELPAPSSTQERSVKRFEASFENLSGLVAVNFCARRNIRQQGRGHPRPGPVAREVDFNVDPFSAVLAVRVNEELHVFDEIVLTGGVTTWDFCEELRSHGLAWDAQSGRCPDAQRGAARKTAGVGSTDHHILRRAGFRVSRPNPPGSNETRSTA